MMQTSLSHLSFYWLSYIFALWTFLGWVYLDKKLNRTDKLFVFPRLFALWIVILFAGRLGYFGIYRPDLLLNSPRSLLDFQYGGMSFFGSLFGVLLFSYFYFPRSHPTTEWLFRRILLITPLFLAAGRLGNVLNQELCGKQTSLSWLGILLDKCGPLPVLPAQVFQLLAEGPILFLITTLLFRLQDTIRADLLAWWLVAYGSLRIVTEFARAPETEHYFYSFLSQSPLNLNQWLSLFTIITSLVYLSRGLLKVPSS